MKFARFKRTFILSVALNLIGLILAGTFVYQKGGIPYLLKTLGFLPSKTLSTTKIWANIYYQHRSSLFDVLPKTGDKIIFLGDSLTDSCEWQEILNNPQVLNRGIIGDTTEGVLQRLNPLVGSQPQQIFIMVGINDLSRGKPISEILGNYQQILGTIRDKSPQTKVYVKSVLPINSSLFKNAPSNQMIRTFNAKLQRLSENFSYFYIDLHSQFVDESQQLDERYTLDGLHLNGNAYLIWKEAIENYVAQ